MSINKHETYSFNPFRIDGKHIRRIPIVDEGVTVGHKFADFEKCIKIYPEAYADFEHMSRMAIKILIYMFDTLGKDADEVYFDINDFFRFTNREKVGVSSEPIKNKAGVYRGIADLLDRNLIARKAGDVKTFYINPAKFFYGKRGEWHNRCKDMPKEIRTILIDKRLNGQTGNW